MARTKLGNYTAGSIIENVRTTTGALDLSVINDPTLLQYINLSVAEIAEMLGAANAPDYGYKEVLSPGLYVFGVSKTSGVSYTQSTKTVSVSAIGAEITAFIPGATILLVDNVRLETKVGQIISVSGTSIVTNITMYGNITTGNCTIATIPSVMNDTTLNLTYSLDKVIKIVSSTLGLLKEVKDYEIHNVSNLSQFNNTMVWNRFGNTIEFIAGSGVVSTGTVYIYYYTQPIPVTASSDTLDLRDMYIPLVIAKVKNYCYEQLNKAAPEALTQLIESRTDMIRKRNAEELQNIKSRGSN